ncbi:MAG: DUF4363 family protein [Anaerovoracaceae bacterium]|jgi:hypothetical protein
MKALWISLISLALILGTWLFFMNASKESINEMVQIIEEETYPMAFSESWADASYSFEKVSRHWKKNKRTFILFTDSEAVAEAEYSFQRIRSFIETGEKGSLCAELVYLKRQLLFLRELEILSIENII